MEIPIFTYDQWNYDKDSGRFTLSWKQKLSTPITKRNNIILVYEQPRPLSLRVEEAIDIWCALLLPHAAVQLQSAIIQAPFTEEQLRFWPHYLKQLGVPNKIELQNKPIDECKKHLNQDINAERTYNTINEGRLALFFGGGVESLSLLNLIMHLKPVLLSLHGPSWMNNDYSSFPIKRELENTLANSYNLQLSRIWHDMRTLYEQDDLYVNKWLTGAFMYYCFVPVMKLLNIRACFISMEKEYTVVSEQYDRSIHPSFVHYISRKPLPALLSVLNAVPKIELLNMLYKSSPELRSYIYSCNRNSQRRWCGECDKCSRISTFCDTIHLPKNLIDMQENIPSVRENGELTKLYWRSVDDYRKNE